MFCNANNENQNQELQDLDLVPPSTIELIFSAVMRGDEEMKESYLHRFSHSMPEFYASCELAEMVGLNLYL